MSLQRVCAVHCINTPIHIFCDNSNGDFEFQFSPFKVKLVYGQQRAIVEMDSFIRKLQKNPRSSSNFVSRLLFSWTIPLFKRTYYEVLQVSDVTEPLTQDRSNLLGDRLERYEKKRLSSLIETKPKP